MNSLNEIKAFIQKNAEVKAATVELMSTRIFSTSLVDEMIEQQQELRYLARSLNIFSIDQCRDKTEVLVKYEKFIELVNIGDCEVAVNERADATYHHYKFLTEDIVLKAVKMVKFEEHKKAQAI